MEYEDGDYEDVVMNENMAYDVPKECSRDSIGSVIYELAIAVVTSSIL